MTKWHIENFNEDLMHLWVPKFAENGSEEDQIWLTFCYAIGQNWGFDASYTFHMQDWSVLNGQFYQNIDARIYDFNKKWGKWLKMGWVNSAEGFFIWPRHPKTDAINSDWEFTEVLIKSPRVQRMWIHLYNQLFQERGKFRNDLFTEQTKINLGEIEHSGWWHTNARVHMTKNRSSHHTAYTEPGYPNYLKKTELEIIKGTHGRGGVTRKYHWVINSKLLFKHEG